MSQFGVFFGQNAVDQNAPDYSGWAGLLAGCVPDARGLAMMFSRLGFDTTAKLSGWNIGKVPPVPAKDWVLTLDCTRQAWIDAHARLQSITQAGDTVIIGNSGHGYQYDTPTQFNGGQGMCFADGLFTDKEHHALMCQWRAGVRVVYVLDTCYSGGMDKARERFRMRVMPTQFKPAGNIERGELRSSDIAAQVIELCASSPTQTSADGDFNGAFTGTLLAVMAQALDRGDVITPNMLLANTRALMGGVFDQTPQMNVLGYGVEIVDLPL